MAAACTAGKQPGRVPADCGRKGTFYCWEGAPGNVILACWRWRIIPEQKSDGMRFVLVQKSHHQERGRMLTLERNESVTLKRFFCALWVARGKTQHTQSCFYLPALPPNTSAPDKEPRRWHSMFVVPLRAALSSELSNHPAYSPAMIISLILVLIFFSRT